MKILVINRGSSSIKCECYQFLHLPEEYVFPLWRESIKDLSQFLKDKDCSDIGVVGHRIVHGGREFYKSVRIDESVCQKIKALGEFAPLHNPLELEAIERVQRSLGTIAQVAVFDTAFHRTMPQAAVVYPIPYAWYDAGIQKYGFHGTSFKYCSERLARLASIEESRKVVICHLGSGASICALKNGVSIDTTMGFTPLDGLMMDTRSGSIDPGILLHLQRKGVSEEALSKMLYEESGLIGVSGYSGDMRDILEKAHEGGFMAELALEVYIHRLCSQIGAMVASLEGIGSLVFTGGIGENSTEIRKRVSLKLGYLGLAIDADKNESCPKSDCEISHSHSSVKVWVIPTQEGFEIAKECYKLITTA